jgi:hypothetical protein
LSHRSQRDTVDFGVDGGAGQIAVAEYLANFGEGSSPSKQLASQGMTEPMGPHRWEVRPNACVPNNSADRVRMHRTLWGMACQKQRPTGASGAPISQICCERLAHINRQRQAVDAVTLASDDNLSCPPVNATQFEVGHLGCAQDNHPQPTVSVPQLQTEIVHPWSACHRGRVYLRHLDRGTSRLREGRARRQSLVVHDCRVELPPGERGRAGRSAS